MPPHVFHPVHQVPRRPVAALQRVDVEGPEVSVPEESGVGRGIPTATHPQDVAEFSVLLDEGKDIAFENPAVLQTRHGGCAPGRQKSSENPMV